MQTDNIDWSGLRAAAVAIGIRPACRQATADMSPEDAARFTERAMKRCSREGWITAADKLRTLATMSAPSALSANVRTGAEIIQNTQLEDSEASKTYALQYARRTLKRAAQVAQDSPDEALAIAPNVASVTKVASTAGAWSQPVDSVRINVFSDAAKVIDVAAEVTPSESQ
jgi:hypothetical protein